jgi:DNA-binding transcriptional regulator YhcF (GntR family)
VVGLDGRERSTVGATRAAIADAPRVDLSAATVKRVLYELADAGILEREANHDTTVQGRPPSRVEPRFSPTVFRRLYDLGEN